MSWRQKSKSGWLAAGKPTSISLKPIATSSWNIFSLRAGSIGSMRAWLPSRRSTEHQRGAWSVTTLGHVRSSRTIGTKAWYFSKGIFFGVTFGGGMSGFSVGCGVMVLVRDAGAVDRACVKDRSGRVGRHRGRKSKKPPAGAAGAGERGYARVRPT